MRYLPLLLAALLLTGPAAASPAEGIDAPALYAAHCASCHGPGRLGAMGPALLPENLGRLKPAEAERTIAAGRPATQMPPFGDRLSPAEIQALAAYVFTPLPQIPAWGMAEIAASRSELNPPDSLPPQPQFQADPQNLFVVVELGDHHLTILDGDRLAPLARLPTRPNLHGGPKFSPDGRYVYTLSRDGWIAKLDLYNLKYVAEIRAGINARNLAVSADGRYVMVANYLPHTLVVLDAAGLTPLKLIPVQDDFGHSSRVSAVYAAPPRHSFIAALKDLPELWEIPYDGTAAALPVYQGVMHDYRTESGEAPPVDPAPFPVRRIHLDGYLDDFSFDADYTNLIGTARDGGKGQVVNLIVGRKVAEVDLPGLPHLASAITWENRGRTLLATPDLRRAEVSVIDMGTWQTIKRIPTLGPGFFMRSHEKSRYAWVDVFFGKDKDAIHVIDKATLEIVKTLRPAPGKTAAHVEFDRYGRYALVSIWDPDGAIVVYDAATLEELKRLPMNKPSGKYNVYNKTHLDRGTSH